MAAGRDYGNIPRSAATGARTSDLGANPEINLADAVEYASDWASYDFHLGQLVYLSVCPYIRIYKKRSTRPFASEKKLDVKYLITRRARFPPRDSSPSMHAAAGTTLKVSRASRTPTLSRPRRAERVLRAASRPRRRGARLAASAKQSAHDDDISDVRLATSAALASATVAATISLAFSVDATLTAMMSAVGLEVAEMEYSTRSVATLTRRSSESLLFFPRALFRRFFESSPSDASSVVPPTARVSR